MQGHARGERVYRCMVMLFMYVGARSTQYGYTRLESHCTHRPIGKRLHTGTPHGCHQVSDGCPGPPSGHVLKHGLGCWAWVLGVDVGRGSWAWMLGVKVVTGQKIRKKF